MKRAEKKNGQFTKDLEGVTSIGQGETIEILDQTIRDGQQSLWGHLLTTDLILPIAPVMDEVGYKEIALVGGRGATVMRRALKENIFDRYRLLLEKFKKTPLRSSIAHWALAGFNMEPLAAIELWIKTVRAIGIKRFMLVVHQNLVNREKYLAEVAKKEGAEIIGTILFQLSPVHTDALWARKARILTKICKVDGIVIEDTAGTLTPERVKTFLPAIQKESEGIPIELHTHCAVGIAPMSYVEAMKVGVRIFHTAVSPLANGSSLPSTENTITNADLLGFETNLNAEALKAQSDYFRRVAQERNLPIGIPVEYNLYQLWHQIPGGMRGTMRNQLVELKQEHRLDEVLEEAGRVRQEFGYPVMVTPYSQIVGGQALFNVTAGERYKAVSDEVIRYILGHYGEADAPIDPNAKDKILSLPKAKKWLNWKEPEVTVEDLRKLEGGLSDEDLLIRIIEAEVGEFRDKLRKLYGW